MSAFERTLKQHLVSYRIVSYRVVVTHVDGKDDAMQTVARKLVDELDEIVMPEFAQNEYLAHDLAQLNSVVDAALQHRLHRQLTAFRLPNAQLVAWHSGRTSVSCRRTFPVLRSTCS